MNYIYFLLLYLQILMKDVQIATYHFEYLFNNFQYPKLKEAVNNLNLIVN